MGWSGFEPIISRATLESEHKNLAIARMAGGYNETRTFEKHSLHQGIVRMCIQALSRSITRIQQPWICIIKSTFVYSRNSETLD